MSDDTAASFIPLSCLVMRREPCTHCGRMVDRFVRAGRDSLFCCMRCRDPLVRGRPLYEIDLMHRRLGDLLVRARFCGMTQPDGEQRKFLTQCYDVLRDATHPSAGPVNGRG